MEIKNNSGLDLDKGRVASDPSVNIESSNLGEGSIDLNKPLFHPPSGCDLKKVCKDNKGAKKRRHPSMKLKDNLWVNLGIRLMLTDQS